MNADPAYYLKHRPPMLLLDKVNELSEDRAVCSVLAEKGSRLSLFEIDEFGRVDVVCGFELIAQTAGVFSGYKFRQEGKEPPFGMLLSVRKLKCCCRCFEPGSRLTISVKADTWGENFSVFNGTVSSGEKLAVTCSLTVTGIESSRVSQLIKNQLHIIQL